MTERYASDWKFRFEGIHGAHFDAYADPQDRIAALQIFTPDVLDVVYGQLPATDIELQGDRMWLVQRNTVLDDKVADRLFAATRMLYGEISKQLGVR